MRCWRGIYADKDDYPNPPVDQATLKSQLDSLSAPISAALDGGKKAIAEREHLKGVVLKSFASTRALRRGELQGQYKHLPEERLSSGYRHTDTHNTGVRLVPKDRCWRQQRSNESVTHGPARRTRLSVTVYDRGSRRNAGNMDRDPCRQNQTGDSHQRVDPRRDLCISGARPNQLGLHRLERVCHANLHVIRERTGEFGLLPGFPRACLSSICWPHNPPCRAKARQGFFL